MLPPQLLLRLSLGAALVPCSLVAQQAKIFTVAPDGHSNFRTVQEAIDHAPAQGAIIRIAPGKYRQKIHIRTPNIHLIGTGQRPDQLQ